MQKRRRLMLYIIAAEVLMIMVNLLVFLPGPKGSTITGAVIGEEVEVAIPQPVSKAKVAFIDAAIFVAIIGIFLYTERQQ